MIQGGLRRRAQIKAKFLSAYKEKTGRPYDGPQPEAATLEGDPCAFAEKAKIVGGLADTNEDVPSLRQLLTIGLK